jgi:SAM-dependent methyltransferase
MILKDLLAHPAARGIDLDAPETLFVHRQILKDKKFLYRLYESFYKIFVDELGSRTAGKVLELGSGGGFLKEKLPQVITSDLCAAPFIDMTVGAARLPFNPEDLSGIVMLNVLHHLAQPRTFFKETSRCLAPGGRLVMIEPFNSWFGKLVYTRLHHEPFNDQAKVWENPPVGRMSTSNIAMPWIIFWRDKAQFEKEFPELRIVKRVPHTPMGYLVSGGMSTRSLAPGFTYPWVAAADRVLSKFSRLFPTLQTLVLEKQL